VSWAVVVTSLKHDNLHYDKSDVMCGKLVNEWCDVAFILKRIYFDGSGGLKWTAQFSGYEVRRLDGRSPRQHCDNSDVHFSRGQGRGGSAFCLGTFFSQASENQQIWCDFDRALSLICGNKMPTRCNRGFYCRSYCLLNMFRAPLCSSSGAQEYYTVVAACGISCCGFQVSCLQDGALQ